MYLLSLLLLILSFMIFTDIGKKIRDKIIILKNIITLIEHEQTDEISALGNRFTLWRMGMERVNLAPFMGIKKSPIYDDSKPITFCCPHNEFIAYWTFTGFLGLLAFVVLIVGLLFKNKNSYHGYYWNGFYIALTIQMLFDAAFQSTRFIPLFFLIVGMNLKENMFTKITIGKRFKALT